MPRHPTPQPAEVDHTSTQMTTIDVEKAVLTKLRTAAAARDCSVEQLARRLLDTIAKEQLADAVLDD
jgi:hypothetical protein